MAEDKKPAKKPAKAASPKTASPKTEPVKPEKPVFPAEKARIDAGYGGPDGLARFAKKMRVSPEYVRRIERRGGAPYIYADRAVYFLNCRWEVFFWVPGRGPGSKPNRSRKTKSTTRKAGTGTGSHG